MVAIDPHVICTNPELHRRFKVSWEDKQVHVWVQTVGGTPIWGRTYGLAPRQRTWNIERASMAVHWSFVDWVWVVDKWLSTRRTNEIE